MEVAPPGFEHAPQLPQAQKWGLDTPGPCNHCTVHYLKLIALKYFSLPFTLFEPCGSAVCIMNSKIHVRKNSLNKYFKVISHCFHVYPYSQALYGLLKLNALVFFFAALAEVQVDHHSFCVKSSIARSFSHLSNRTLLCLQPAVICLRNTLWFANIQ